MTVAAIGRCFTAVLLMCSCASAFAHGSVVAETDSCLIEIGFYSAHFTIFQPQTREHREFCEDIPDVTESVFIMEYLHDSMREVPVDFRIIRERENRGRFVTWEDIEAIEDLERETVFYQAPVARQDGVFTVVHQFDAPGDYIGIVTTVHPTKNLHYKAIFPFRVGGTSWGYWPLFVFLIVVVQVSYWVMSGGYARWRQKKRHRLIGGGTTA